MPLSTHAAAGDATTVRLTFHTAPNGDFFGYVGRRDPVCADGREVIVYEARGRRPNPARDKLFAQDISEPFGPNFIWEAGHAQRGRYYTYAPATDGCEALRSKNVVRITRRRR